MRDGLIVFCLFSCVFAFAQKTYVKNYYPNNSIKEEGWMENNQKTDYWFFYNEKGSKVSEGHFAANKKCNWWVFYNTAGEIVKKCEFNQNKLDGFSIVYEKNKIVKAEEFSNNKKIKEWESLEDFKNDNPFFFY